MLAVPYLIDFWPQSHCLAVLVHWEVWVVVIGISWFISFLLKNILINCVKVLHDVFFFDEFPHQF